jgi:hypothetical protein
MLLLAMYSSTRHDALHAYGNRLQEFVDLPPHRLADRLLDYGEHISDKFAPNLYETLDTLREDLFGFDETSAPTPERRKAIVARSTVSTLVERAFEAARIEYKARLAVDAPAVALVLTENLGEWRIARRPDPMIVALGQWFQNCLEHGIDVPNDREPQIAVQLTVARFQRAALTIRSPKALPASKVRALERETGSFLRTLSAPWIGGPAGGARRGRGLPLIRDMLWYGYRSAARYRTVDGQAELVIPMRVRRVRK